MILEGQNINGSVLRNNIDTSSINECKITFGYNSRKATMGLVSSGVGGWVGAAIGAKGGAIIGTWIFPGIGTALGAAAGGLTLGLLGDKLGGSIGSHFFDN